MKEHYLKEKDSASYFYIIILFFSIYSMLFIFSGAAVFYLKTGYTLPGVYEYYMGSEKALKMFPDLPDRFMNPKTTSGILKTIIPHLISYGIIIFIGLHFFNTLKTRSYNFLSRFFSFSIFPIAMIEINSGMLVISGPYWMIYVRLGIFFLFVILVIALNISTVIALMQR